MASETRINVPIFFPKPGILSVKIPMMFFQNKFMKLSYMITGCSIWCTF